MIGFYFFDNVHVNADGKITEPMSENKQKRDANGRFVKSTEPKKQETKKSPCVKPNYEKMYNALNSAYKYVLEEKNALVNEYHKIRHEKENVLQVLICQRKITKEISSRLNWFQRIRLRKIMAQYPYDMYGYYMEKDV